MVSGPDRDKAKPSEEVVEVFRTLGLAEPEQRVKYVALEGYGQPTCQPAYYSIIVSGNAAPATARPPGPANAES